MIEATTNSVKRELIPAGNYIARCFSMIHIGTIEEEIQKEKKLLNKVRITWELPTETRVFDESKGEQPMIISKEYTLSMHEKANLRRDLESWRGKAFTEDQAKSFDITKLLGVPCMINIIHKSSTTGTKYATISSITPIPKGLTCPDAVNPSFEFNFTDKFSDMVVESFPDFIKDKIKSSQEYKDLKSPVVDLPGEEENQDDNDLPF